ncbi:MAG TPA: hypothetical protein VJO53_06200 [Candidatus Acidoferrales bacterium]|nr:hypothetical protein [Candidatus Acidoferrales bacterium]
MIGMNFGGFVTLLILGLIAGLVIHFIIRYRMLGGFDGFMSKWIAGWIGGWLGSPVLGHWGFQIQNIYVIPALVGAFIGAFAFPALMKTSVGVREPKATTAPAIPAEMLRKAS